MVSEDSRMFSATSFGVFCREAPSTSAIIGTKVSPGLLVMVTTMRSESTVVPPLTAHRSPPDSRITGADSPVMADSSTLAMPSTTSPSPGMTWPATTTTRSPGRRSAAGTSRPSSMTATAVVLALRSDAACALAAALGDGLGDVGEQHGQPQPDRDRPAEHGGVQHASTVENTEPTQTVNTTGWRTSPRGRACGPRR